MNVSAVRVGAHRYPVVLPSIGDARLHAAGVVMTIHVLGQTALGFAVSVPQIAAAILTAASIDIGVVARRDGKLVWPASAMLTGSGVGLIMRVAGTTPGEHWSFHRWYLYAAVAAASVATKHTIRWRGSHLFNPSNVGLVAAFLLLGSSRVEPLDLWWHPIGPAMVIAYAVILVGGLAITARLGLLGLAAAFWCTMLAGLAVLARSRHCIVVAWDPRPVCDWHFWWTFATSPEILIFVFFMITDPKTVPTRAGHRIAFGVAVGALAAALIAPQTTEFRAKVALLAALTVVTAARPLVEGVAPWWTRRLPTTSADVRGAALGVTAPIVVLGLALGLVALGAPARRALVAPVRAAALPSLATILDWREPATLPAITADPAVAMFGPELVATDGQHAVALALLRGLAVEGELLRRRDAVLLRAVDHGSRLDELTAIIEKAGDGSIDVSDYVFDAMRLIVVRRGRQSGALVGIEAEGRARSVAYSSDGRATAEHIAPVRLVAALRPASDARWLIVDVTVTDQ